MSSGYSLPENAGTNFLQPPAQLTIAPRVAKRIYHSRSDRLSLTAAATIFILSLSGCSTLPPAPTEVLIPVATPCLTRDQIPAQDFLPDSALAALDDRALVIQLRVEQLKGRGERI